MNAIEELRYLILASQREGDRLLSAALEPIGLTTSQAEVLRVLYDHAPLSLIELGERLVCETGSPSRLVNTLVEKGLVERTPAEHDRRMVILALSITGRKLTEQVIVIEQAFYAGIASVFGDTSLEEINEILWKFVTERPTGEALIRRKAKL
ncbi:transcriptional regulator [Synechococcus sp. PCC 7502]|uniref:MarR family winged helix-turn-helix transcriptional regulator n=1 Tax=Synechococcus sp. PCC 7502 TaxID=1173263 RepID=UPI00029FF89A|nr:MarR family transcriptional regulator [Synechococcus sp. PCC 7502]AFY75413.1 transcriptional regulator [Synechococcus sp. PCC 7502]